MRLIQQLNISKAFYPASSRQRAKAAVYFVAVTLTFVLFHFAAQGGINIDRWVMPCGFKQRFGLPCPTCGMTAAVLAFAHGKILEAFYIQPAAALICCVLVVSAFLAFLIAVFGVYFTFLNRLFEKLRAKHIILIIIGIVAVGWVITLARAIPAS